MMQPSVAIIIPVYNEAAALEQTIKMLEGLRADEIIFVDGGSTDQSRGLIRSHGYPCLESTAGRAKQMNIGAKGCKSDIILFLHADTIISSSHLLSIKKTYNQGYLSGRFDIRFDNDRIRYRILSLFINLRSRATKISTGDQAIFVARRSFEAFGGYKEMPLMEDIEFSARLKATGRVACLKETVVTSSRRWENHGFAATILLMWRLRFLYWLGVPAEKLVQYYRDTR